jgi:hypothetical protein
MRKPTLITKSTSLRGLQEFARNLACSSSSSSSATSRATTSTTVASSRSRRSGSEGRSNYYRRGSGRRAMADPTTGARVLESTATRAITAFRKPKFGSLVCQMRRQGGIQKSSTLYISHKRHVHPSRKVVHLGRVEFGFNGVHHFLINAKRILFGRSMGSTSRRHCRTVSGSEGRCPRVEIVRRHCNNVYGY